MGSVPKVYRFWKFGTLRVSIRVLHHVERLRAGAAHPFLYAPCMHSSNCSPKVHVFEAGDQKWCGGFLVYQKCTKSVPKSVQLFPNKEIMRESVPKKKVSLLRLHPEVPLLCLLFSVSPGAPLPLLILPILPCFPHTRPTHLPLLTHMPPLPSTLLVSWWSYQACSTQACSPHCHPHF